MAPKLNLPTRAPGGEDFGREVFSFTAGIKIPFWVNGLKTKARYQDDTGPHQRKGQTGKSPRSPAYNAQNGSIAGSGEVEGDRGRTTTFLRSISPPGLFRGGCHPDLSPQRKIFGSGYGQLR